MPRARIVTAAQAQAVLAEVRRVFRPYVQTSPEYGPKLVRDFDGGYGVAPWAVVWEEGPFEWAIRATAGGVDEELSGELLGVVRSEPIRQPEGIFCEPYTSWSLGIYLD